MPKINEEGLELIKKSEGLVLTAYKDAVGTWTVGYGHTGNVKPGMVINEIQAEQILKKDLEYFEKGIQSLVKVQLNSNQFSALVSLSFNIGLGAFKESTLLKSLNGYNFKKASNEFLKWTKAGNKVLPGLVKRREAERELFLKEVSKNN